MMYDDLIPFVIVMIAVMVYLGVMRVVSALPSMMMMIGHSIPYLYFA